MSESEPKQELNNSPAIKVEIMQEGQEYGFSPNASVVQDFEVGLDEPISGEYFRVVTGFELNPQGTDNFGSTTVLLVNHRSPKGVETLGLVGARRTDDGSVTATRSGFIALPQSGSDVELIVGRDDPSDNGPGKVAIETIFNDQPELSTLGYTSRKHLGIKVNSEGTIIVRSMGSNGTGYWQSVPRESGVRGTLLEQNQKKAEISDLRIVGTLAITQAQQVPDKEADAQTKEFDFSMVDRYAPVSEDPQYQAIVTPFQDQLSLLERQYDEQRNQLLGKARKSMVHPEDDPKIQADLRAVRLQYESSIIPIKEALESTVRPYLAARLRLSIGETGPAYAIPGELQTDLKDRDNIVSKRGERVARRSHTSDAFVDNIVPHIGQFDLPENFKDWAGTGSGKSDAISGEAMTSFDRIVDLAAAMAAGTFHRERDPATAELRKNSQYLLPRDFKNLKIYKIKDDGRHRLAAKRLLMGVDARFDAEIPFGQR